MVLAVCPDTWVSGIYLSCSMSRWLLDSQWLSVPVVASQPLKLFPTMQPWLYNTCGILDGILHTSTAYIHSMHQQLQKTQLSHKCLTWECKCCGLHSADVTKTTIGVATCNSNISKISRAIFASRILNTHITNTIYSTNVAKIWTEIGTNIVSYITILTNYSIDCDCGSNIYNSNFKIKMGNEQYTIQPEALKASA